MGRPGRKPMITGELEKTACQLYAEGKVDKEVAEALGVCSFTVFSWRKRNGLKANGRGGRPLSAEDHAARLALFREGKNDREIASALVVNPVTICQWRKKHKLITYYNKRHKLTDDERRMKGYEMGLSDSEIAAQTGTNRRAVYKWRQRRKLPANAGR